MTDCPIMSDMIVSSEPPKSSTLSNEHFNGAQSLQPIGFRLINSLSTLNDMSYPNIAQDPIINVLGQHF